MTEDEDICGPCIDGDHDECTDVDGTCMCIDMEHDNEEQRAYALHDGWVD